MNPIKLLPQNLINQIAAGEVIERPASVLKELVENSVDAGADEISVAVKSGGMSELIISDNGSGIPEDQVETAFMKHATSKISDVTDLFNIQTLGFRGEALASISSIAKVSVESRTAGSDVAYKCRIENGKVVGKGISGRVRGTTFCISDLFYNIPARKKFLKSESTEKTHLVNEFTNIAIVNYQVKLSLEINDKPYLVLPKCSSELERIENLFPDLKGKLIEISDVDGLVNASIYLTHPKDASEKKSPEYTIVNGRVVKDMLVRKAVLQAYHGLQPANLHPSFFVFLKVAPKFVDVNVHPKKMEVRWEDSAMIFRKIMSTCRNFLEKELRAEVRTSLTPESEIGKSMYDNLRQASAPTLGVSTTQLPRREYAEKFSPSATYKPSSVRQTTAYMDFAQSLFSTDSVKVTDKPEAGNIDFLSASQVLFTYLIVEYSDKIQLIDQHAAAERITYDKLREIFDNRRSFSTQDLLSPIPLELSLIEVEILEELLPFFSRFGIEFSQFGKDSFAISGLPLELGSKNVENLIKDTLSDIKSSGEDIDSLMQFGGTVDKVIATMACHSSIRGGDKMSQSEIKWLLEELFKTTRPYSCPHGRPIIWELSKYDLEKHFGRVQ